MKITITPGQGVLIHGWWRARESLTWGDVLLYPSLKFADLLDRCNVPESSLQLLQPDLQAWVKAGKVGLEDTPRLGLWGAHPIRDFKADLADLVRMRWTAEQYARMGVTHGDLLELGLTAETMGLFGFTLMMWSTLGFRRADAERIAAPLLYRLFGMTKQDVLACLK